MAALPPAVAAARQAVRESTADLPPGSTVLVACSGGTDSLALAAAAAFSCPRDGLRIGVVSVDHGLQPESATWAARVVDWALALGVDLAEVLTPPAEQSSAGGPEAVARRRRYRVLYDAAERYDAAAVLLGHTLDDQAETVLLGLARGSGARSLAGMPRTRGRFRRPFLDLTRATTAAVCAALGVVPIQDPHNDDPAYTRVRVRRDALPALEAALGPGVAAALARTARLLRDDADALDLWAARALEEVTAEDGLDVDQLAALPAAVRTRVLRLTALRGGVPGGALAAVHVDAVDALVTSWHGQGPVDLPGGHRALRSCGRLRFTAAPR